MIETCPSCRTDLRGAPIPQQYIDKGFYSPGATHYSRIVGVEIRGVYDGVLYWQCPDCGHCWHRWDEGHPRRGIAERYMTK